MALNARQIRERDYYFGRDNYTNRSNSCLSFNSVLSEDEIIIQTDHVVSIVNKNNEVQYLFLIANNKAIYLDYNRQVKRATFYNEQGEKKKTYLVKLSRSKFRPYYCKKFKGHDFEREISFDSLLDEARIQNSRKTKVRIS